MENLYAMFGENHHQFSDIAGVAYPPRHAQPDMFSILSWVDGNRPKPDAAITSDKLTAPKKRIENRWVGFKNCCMNVLC